MKTWRIPGKRVLSEEAERGPGGVLGGYASGLNQHEGKGAQQLLKESRLRRGRHGRPCSREFGAIEARA